MITIWHTTPCSLKCTIEIHILNNQQSNQTQTEKYKDWSFSAKIVYGKKKRKIVIWILIFYMCFLLRGHSH